MIFKQWILWFGLICTSFNGLAQDTYAFQHLSRADGLSQASVFAIAQDRSGFMWFGTRNGLNRYDGYQFKVYKKDTTDNSIPADDVRNLYADTQTNHLWIGTNYGVSKYNLFSDQFTNYFYSASDSTSISSNVIRRIFRDSKGRLWIGTAMGVNLYDAQKDRFKRYLMKQPSAQQSAEQIGVWAFLEDSSGQLWFGTSNGLYQLIENPGGDYTFQRFDDSEALTLNEPFIRGLVEDAQGNFWIGTDQAGMHYWDRTRGTVKVFRIENTISESISNNHVRDMCMDANQTLWVATFNGLNYLKKGASEFKVLKKDKLNEAGISDNSIHALFLDKRNSLWVGTFYGGVNHLDEHYNRFTNFRHNPFKKSLSVDVVGSFVEGKDGNLWIGTEGGGLNFYNKSTSNFEQFQSRQNANNPLKSDNIKKLLIDGDSLWIGTFQGGLSLLNLQDKSFQHFLNDPNDPNSISGDNIYGLYKDQEKLWVLTYGKGLTIFDLSKRQFHRFRKDRKEKNSISSDLLRTILVTKDRQFWLGTEEGLNKVEINEEGFPASFETFLPEERIHVLQESWEGKIWIGTFSNGLFYFNPENGELEHFTIKDGLPGNSVFGVIEINEQELWLSTNNGLSKFNPQQKTFTNYDLSNGLANLEYNFNAYYKTRSGAILFGGINGFTLFHPQAIQTNQAIPTVIFTELRKKDELIDLYTMTNAEQGLTKGIEPIKFKYNNANFSIRFAALDFISPENNRYAYKLDGLDRDWNYTIGENVASYTIQRDGEYTFRLKGANSDGLWNPEERLLKIVVLPPPWRSWWAYLIYLVSLCALAIGLIRYVRLRHKLQLQQVAKQQQDELHELKLRFFTNITHEFRTPLTLILGPLKELINKEKHSEQVEKKLQSIHSNTERLLNLVNQVLTFRKLATDHEPMQAVKGDLVCFLKEIFLPFEETANIRQIDYRFMSRQDQIMAWYDPDKLEKVFFNLLANAFKFTPDGGCIELRILEKNTFVEIQVADNGIGIEPELHEQIFERFYNKSIANRSNIKGTGIGLAISKQMVELHRGKIFVEKESRNPAFHKGATFIVQIPIGRVHLKEINELEHFPKGEKIENYQPIKPKEAALIPLEPIKKADQPLILIVEDNQSIADYIQQVFAGTYQVIKAPDGLIGLEQVKKHTPDLIISDVMMPNMDGITFCRKVKTDLEISHIPIILLTARTAAILKIEGLKTGADDYVTKPFDPEELLLRVRNIIQARKEVKEKFVRVLSFDPKEITVTSADEQFLEQALQVVEEHIEDYEFNVVQFARELAVSRPLLFTKLKALTGQTPNNFIKTIRLKRAAQLLQTQKLNVSEVAYKVGFKDPKYFRKCFKEQFDQVPSDFSKGQIA